jgi:hypothetical protein
MPITGAKAILLCSDDGNNVRTAQRWAKTHEVVFVRVGSALGRVFVIFFEGSAAGGYEGDKRYRCCCCTFIAHVTLYACVSSATDLAIAYHKINTTAFALDAISSLWNLGMCTAFVGTFS